MQNKLIRFYRAPLLLVDFLFTQLPVLAQHSPKPDEEPAGAWTTSNWFWLGGAVLVTVLFVRMTRPKSESPNASRKAEDGGKVTHILSGRVRRLIGHRKSHQL